MTCLKMSSVSYPLIYSAVGKGVLDILEGTSITFIPKFKYVIMSNLEKKNKSDVSNSFYGTNTGIYKITD